MSEARQYSSGKRDWWALHLWQLQPVRDILILLGFGLIIWAGYKASVVTIPLLLGLTLAYLFEPIVHRLAARVGRPVAAGLTIAVVVLAIVVPALLGAGVAVSQGVGFVGRAAQGLPELRERVDEYVTRYDQEGLRSLLPLGGDEADPASDDASEQSSESSGEAQPDPTSGESADVNDSDDSATGPDAGEQDDEVTASDWIDDLLAYTERNALQLSQKGLDALSTGANIISGAAYVAFMLLFLTPFFFFFMSVGLGRVRQLIEELIPSDKRGETLTILHKMDLAISGFVRGRLTISAILAVLFTIGYALVGVPAPLILGPLIGLMSIVPYLALVGWPITILAMAVNEVGAENGAAWWWILLGPSIVYWALQSIDDYLLTPLIQRRSVNLDTPTIMVAVLGGGALAGVYGVLVALPAAACIKILASDVFWPRYKSWVEGRVRDPLPIDED